MVHLVRLDKLLAGAGFGSRSDIKKLVRKGGVLIDGRAAVSADEKVDPNASQIAVNGQAFVYKEHLYLMLNKPAGVLSASNDKRAKTVVDLVPPALFRPGLFPAGRLDRDTEGFVLLTDDGQLAHKILSPKSHIPKIYYAQLDGPIDPAAVAAFAQGIALDDGTVCMPAELTVLGANAAQVVLHEGKYHQVKRMFAAVGRTVLYLKRTQMGRVPLDENLALGECRELTRQEIIALCEC